MQTSMNVLRAATTVTRSVPTLLVPSPAPAILDTPSLLMEEHAIVSSIILYCKVLTQLITLFLFYIQMLILVTLTMEAVIIYVPAVLTLPWFSVLVVQDIYKMEVVV